MYDPKELSPFELQFLKAYSTRMRDEKEFYEQGECNE
jgi:hypothetical protein